VLEIAIEVGGAVLRAGGVLGPDLRRRVLDERVEDEQEDGDVVRLAEDRDRVGDEVDGERHVGERRHEHSLQADGRARVANDAPDDPKVHRELDDESGEADRAPRCEQFHRAEPSGNRLGMIPAPPDRF
jgi:hypothetical protein